eukprot:jgi/Ulvmu1/281/UM001_0285.1
MASQPLPQAMVPRTLFALTLNLLLIMCFTVALIIVLITAALHSQTYTTGLNGLLTRHLQVEHSTAANARSLGQKPCRGTADGRLVGSLDPCPTETAAGTAVDIHQQANPWAVASTTGHHDHSLNASSTATGSLAAAGLDGSLQAMQQQQAGSNAAAEVWQPPLNLTAAADRLQKLDNMTMAIMELELGFRMPAPASLSYSSSAFCPHASEPPAAALQPLPPAVRPLFLMSATPTITAWLTAALQQHRHVLSADRSFTNVTLAGPRSDVRFFDRWPLPETQHFLRCFPQAPLQRQLAEAGSAPAQGPVLLDSTGSYLHSAAVAPRLRQVAPQARFVVVLQEPVALAFTRWRALRQRRCAADKRPCSVPTFEEVVVREAASAITQQHCFFDEPGGNRTWAECFGCVYGGVHRAACRALPHSAKAAFAPCAGGEAERLDLLAVGQYAAQLASWLSYFPADRFLILTSDQFQGAAAAGKVLQRVAEHALGSKAAAAGVQPPHPPPAVPRPWQQIPMSDSRAAAAALLRARYSRPLRDLRQLLGLLRPGTALPGLGGAHHN